MKKLNKHWPAIQLIILNWWIFATLALIAVNWYLRKEIKSLNQDKAEMAEEIQNLRHNFEEIEKQYGSSEVILKLKGGEDK